MSDQLINTDAAPQAPQKRSKPGPKPKTSPPDIKVSFKDKTRPGEFTTNLDLKRTATLSRFCENLGAKPDVVLAAFLRRYFDEIDAKQVEYDEWFSKTRAAKMRETYSDLAQLLPDGKEEET